MSTDVERQWAGQCEAWWDTHTCQPVSAPKNPQPERIMRCVLEVGHDPIAETAAAGGHNFGGLGPYTPGMPGWKAQQRALGLPDERPRGVEEQYELARLRREHELLRATLGSVLAQFTDNSYLGQPCSRMAWIPAEVVASWRELHASVAVDQLKEGQER